MKKSLSDMAREAERLEAARLSGKLICPASKAILRVTQGAKSGMWFMEPCRLGCKGCDLPDFFRFRGWASEEALKEAFRQAAMVEELI